MFEVQVFTHPEFGSVPCHNIDGKPWFVGREAALRLEYTNPNEAVRLHVPARHRRSEKIATPGAVPFQHQVLINEAGLYRLILRSNMPKAEEFTDWVTEELLPTVRKAQAVGIDVVEELRQRVAEQQKIIDMQNQQLIEESMDYEDYIEELLLETRGCVAVKHTNGRIGVVSSAEALERSRAKRADKVATRADAV
jgi:anti-repressor protein